MELAKRMQEKNRADILCNDDTSAEDQRSVTEVSPVNEHTKEPEVKTCCKKL